MRMLDQLKTTLLSSRTFPKLKQLTDQNSPVALTKKLKSDFDIIKIVLSKNRVSFKDINADLCTNASPIIIVRYLK